MTLVDDEQPDHQDLDGADPSPGSTAEPASPRAPATGPTLRFLLVAIVAVALFVATYLVLVWTEPGQRIENVALRGAELRTDAEREAALGRLSVVTVAIFALAVVGVLAVGFLRRREPLALMAATAMVTSVALAQLLKAILPRPELVEGPAWLLRNSFPSGSAAVAASIAIGALLVAPDRLRWVTLLAGVLFAALIGEAVQTTGWHRLSDTIGGVLLVIAVAGVGLTVLAVARYVEPSEAARIDPRIVAVLLLLAAGTVVLGAGLAVLPTVFPLLGAPADSRQSILQTAFPLVGVGISVLAIVAFARVIEPYSLGRRSATDAPD
jgi:MFS family permease